MRLRKKWCSVVSGTGWKGWVSAMYVSVMGDEDSGFV